MLFNFHFFNALTFRLRPNSLDEKNSVSTVLKLKKHNPVRKRCIRRPQSIIPFKYEQYFLHDIFLMRFTFILLQLRTYLAQLL